MKKRDLLYKYQREVQPASCCCRQGEILNIFFSSSSKKKEEKKKNVAAQSYKDISFHFLLKIVNRLRCEM